MSASRTTFKLDIFTRILKECLAPTNEKVLLVGDDGIGINKASAFLTQAYSLACEELGLDYETIYQNTKARGEPADAILIKRLRALPKNSIVMLNASNRMGSIAPLGHSFRSYMKSRDHRFTSASTLGTIKPSNLPDLINALDINYKQAQKRSGKVKKALDNGTEAHISTPAGTDLTMDITDMTARQADGIYTTPGTGGNLPGSEAYIAPKGKGVEGIAVIDGSARVRNGTRIIRNQWGIKMRIEDGSVKSMNKTPEAKELEATLNWANRKAEHPWGIRRIGELGIGTNPRARIVGSMILDEKVQGSAHIALGSNKWFGGSIAAIIHLDQVMRDATIRVDNRVIRP